MKTLKERFDEKWKLDPITGCWAWTSPLEKCGRGRLWMRGQLLLAHRVSYAIHHNHGIYPPSSISIMHTCARLDCVNPVHLFAGDHLDEDSRAINGRPHPRGDERSYAKVTSEDVLRMRAMFDAGTPICEIARAVHAPRHVVRDAVHMKTWRHVESAR